MSQADRSRAIEADVGVVVAPGVEPGLRAVGLDAGDLGEHRAGLDRHVGILEHVLDRPGPVHEIELAVPESQHLALSHDLSDSTARR